MDIKYLIELLFCGYVNVKFIIVCYNIYVIWINKLFLIEVRLVFVLIRSFEFIVKMSFFD